jgi:hypothetical protein
LISATVAAAPYVQRRTVPTPRIPEAVRRVFLEAFTARDIAEPLVSFDANSSAADVRVGMEAQGLDVVGIRKDGQIIGFVRRESLDSGVCGQHCQPFEGVSVLDDTSPMLQVLLELQHAPVVFVSMFGRPGGIVTRAELEKPPVRMWLFGMLTLIEMRFTELIERHSPADAWMSYVSEGRLQKARDLQAERQRRNLPVRLFDCLQLADKGQIVARDEQIRRHTIFASRGKAEEVVKMLERLRNNLAHMQDIVTTDWNAIVRLCEFAAHQFDPANRT